MPEDPQDLWDPNLKRFEKQLNPDWCEPCGGMWDRLTGSSYDDLPRIGWHLAGHPDGGIDGFRERTKAAADADAHAKVHAAMPPVAIPTPMQREAAAMEAMATAVANLADTFSSLVAIAGDAVRSYARMVEYRTTEEPVRLDFGDVGSSGPPIPFTMGSSRAMDLLGELCAAAGREPTGEEIRRVLFNELDEAGVRRLFAEADPEEMRRLREGNWTDDEVAVPTPPRVTDLAQRQSDADPYHRDHVRDDTGQCVVCDAGPDQEHAPDPQSAQGVQGDDG